MASHLESYKRHKEIMEIEESFSSLQRGIEEGPLGPELLEELKIGGLRKFVSKKRTRVASEE
jgi:hypothetical protein